MIDLAALPAAEARIARRYMEVEVEKGMTVEVYKGRKVPKGTVGKVFWMGAGQYGWRVGINDEMGDTHWTALTNVRAIAADKDPGETWVEYEGRKAVEAVAREAARIARWDEVVILAEPDFKGKVFWERDGRIGVARLGAKRVRVNGNLRNKEEDTRWVDAADVCKLADYEPEPEVAAPVAVVEETWAEDFEASPF